MAKSPKRTRISAEGPRRCALRVLQRVQFDRVPSQAALDQELRAGRVSPADRGLATELVYGVLRHRRRLDRWLAGALDRGLRELPGAVHDSLRLGLYQLALLDRVPDHAAIAATIDEVRSTVGPKRVGLINAVLRRLSRERPWAGDHSSGLPDWLKRRVQDYAAELSISREALVASFDERAPQHIHALRGSEAVASLERDGVEVSSVGDIPGVYRVESGDFFASEVFRQRRAIPQDAASAAVVEWLQLKGTERVLELCAGRGAKSLFLTDAAGSLTSVDLSAYKLRAALRLTNTAGTPTPLTVAADAARPLPFTPASFDAVLCDAPCSGLGTLRRRPEIRHHRAASDLPRSHELQRQILDQAAAQVRPGGLLVYAVCSFVEEEGPLVISRFLEANPKWRREPTDVAWAQPLLDQRGDLRSHALWHGVDAFYAARLRLESA